MIANIIHFYSGGITVSEAKNMSLSELDRYLKLAEQLNKDLKKAYKNGV